MISFRRLSTVLGSVLVALLVLAVGTASATDLNLTVVGGSGTINNAFFLQIDPQATGTGLIDSFAEIGANTTTTQGYNTTVNGVFDNGSADNFNHSITLGQVPIVVNPPGAAPGSYYEFLLDINESSGGGEEFISLDEIQVFWGGSANPSSTTFVGGVLTGVGTLAYRLDAGSDSMIALNYALNAGSGSGDMFMYIPVGAFAGATADSIVTLYSHFGGEGTGDPDGAGPIPTGAYGTSDGFEEWAIQIATPPTVPEPSSITLLLLGLTGIGSYTWLRKRN